ncbi:hypothetical protein BY996DRAFT_4572046, partial [Phakopsora pachyrhizi]
DHQIKSEYIQLVNPASTTNNKDTGSNQSLINPALTREVLDRLDLNKYTLIEVNSSAKPPICKIVEREALIEKERLKIKKQKLQKRVNRHDSIVKEVQLSWFIGANDLEHKLKAVQQSFDKGYKVRIVISSAYKKQEIHPQRKADFLDLVEEKLIGMKGEKIKEETEGRKLIVEWH